ncbi:hypothetical protein QBC36DRAFT_305251 [Triangularia setosa]|uniref:Uncharacterized protein n=1 Tax=Triangularia setosa TaxID=2587417 RepID=A0AAN6VZ99_9PEZI|nr:hypothetical protein QBC36DRAFT_305251 [Podospora setosa]
MSIFTEVTVYIPTESRVSGEKLAPRGVKGKLLAVLGQQTYLVYLGLNKVTQTSFVKFYEDPKTQLAGPLNLVSPLEVVDQFDNLEDEPDVQPTVEDPVQIPDPGIPAPPTLAAPSTTIEITLPQATREQREEFEPIDEMDCTELISYLVSRFLETLAVQPTATSSEPNTFKQALKHPNKDQWLQAAFTELQQLLTTKTLYFVNRSKAKKRLITSRWVFK